MKIDWYTSLMMINKITPSVDLYYWWKSWSINRFYNLIRIVQLIHKITHSIDSYYWWKRWKHQSFVRPNQDLIIVSNDQANIVWFISTTDAIVNEDFFFEIYSLWSSNWIYQVAILSIELSLVQLHIVISCPCSLVVIKTFFFKMAGVIL